MVPTGGREGCSGAVSAAAGAAGESSKSSFLKTSMVKEWNFKRRIFIFEKEKL